LRREGGRERGRDNYEGKKIPKKRKRREREKGRGER